MKISTFSFVVLVISLSFIAVSAKQKKENDSNKVATIALDSARLSAENAEKLLAEKKKERLILEYKVSSKSMSASEN